MPMRPAKKAEALNRPLSASAFLPIAALMVLAWCAPAHADFRVCNKTASRIGVALGYKGETSWQTEGWWSIDADTCATLLPGKLAGRYYYMYAVDYDHGGEWSGNSAFLCTQEKLFTIEGTNDCVARGFQRTGFYEVDTGDQENWTVQLTEPTSRSVGGK